VVCRLPTEPIRSSGGWNRTSGLHVQSVASLPAATTPESSVGFGKKDSNLHRLIQSQGACQLADSRERPAGVEPACRTWAARAWPLGPGCHAHFSIPDARFQIPNLRISAGSGIRTPVAWLEARSRATGPIPRCVRFRSGRRIEPGFPTSRTKCPAGVEPALPPWQGDRLPLHHGHSSPKPNCQGNREHRVGLEPTSPHYGCGVLATRRPVLITALGPEGLEPSPAWLRARGSATRALVPQVHFSQSNSSRPGRS
jgi:hypothetical protein